MAAAEANERTDALRTLLMNFQGGQAVLPNSMVVEVLPYAPPIGIDGAPAWALGTMLWKALTLPLVSLEYLIADKPSEAPNHNRIVIVQAVGNNPKLPNVGFVGSEAPRIIDLQREDIARELSLVRKTGIASQVLVHGQSGVIPDIDYIEATLGQLLVSARST